MRVLVALDERPISRRAAREAARLFPDALFLVVNVTRRGVPWVVRGPFGAVYSSRSDDFAADELDEDTLTATAEAVGLEHIEALALEGDPATAICEAAEAHDVDIVVVGSHDRGVLWRLLDPSVAQAVVRGTYRPVLVVSGQPPA
jgi:nucleotide-binding universal stress UspA family protein